MNTLGKCMVSAGFLIAGGISLFVLSSLKRAPASSQRDVLPPVVKTIKVRDQKEGFWLSVDGEVTPYREVTISAEVAGQIKIKDPQCFAGQYVKKGEVLLQIDPADYDLEMERLGELASQARINAEELEVEHRNTLELIKLADEELNILRGELERITSLNRRNVATDSDLDAARRNELASRNTMQTLENQKALLEKRRERMLSDIHRIEAELQKARLDRQRTEIRAPINGVVTEDLVEAGAFVDRGLALVRLEDTSKVEVNFNLQFSQLQWLWQYADKQRKSADRILGSSYKLPHLPVEVILAVEDQQFQWQGELARYNGAGVNAVTRTVPCVAIVEERAPIDVTAGGLSDVAAPPALLRGMFVTVRIKIDPQVAILGIPVNAVRPGDRLWVLRDGKLAIEPINVAISVDGEALVVASTTSVKAGDEVITSPLPLAIEGMSLRKAGSEGIVAPPVSVSRQES